jgi:hypothetical protein
MWNGAYRPPSTQLTVLGIHLPAFPIPAGKKRTEASKCDPQLNMMRENTDGLCNFAHCKPFWMVPMTLNPGGLRVNYFFREFKSIQAGQKLRNDRSVNLFSVNYLQGQLRTGFIGAYGWEAADQFRSSRLEGPMCDVEEKM